MVLTPYISSEEEVEERSSCRTVDKENIKGCSVCGVAFNWLFSWKHHCRVCATPVCSSCSVFLQDPRIHKSVYRQCSTCGEEKNRTPLRRRKRGAARDPNVSPDRNQVELQQKSLSYPLSVETIKYAGKAIEILQSGERIVSMIVITCKAVYVLNHKTLSRKRRIPFKSIRKLVQSTDDYSVGIKIRKRMRLVLSSLESCHILHSLLSLGVSSMLYVKHLRNMRRYLYHGDTEVLIVPPSNRRSTPRHVRIHTI